MKNKSTNTILRLLEKGSISDRAYRIYIDSGKTSDNTIRLLALKVMKNKKLSEKETVIFFGKTSEVNQMIVAISKNNF